MKQIKRVTILAVIACLVFGACKKENKTPAVIKPDIELTANLAGDTVTIAAGKTISITLGNPGDGGFSLNDIEFTSDILKLNSHTHQDPAQTGSTLVPGSYGTDTWLFTAIKSGSANVKLTATQRWTGGVTAEMFNGIVTVK